MSAMTASSASPSQVHARHWVKEWFGLTFVGALALTALDAVLLQQKKAFFTGGFLAVDTAETPGQALMFVAASLLSDAAVLGVMVLLAATISRPLRLNPAARRIVVLSLSLGPLVLADFLQYRLLAYLGDAFDFSLMFELTGRKFSEILAVAAAHLTEPALLGLAAAAAMATLVWLANTRLRSARSTGPRTPARGPLIAIALFTLGLVASAVASASSDTIDNGLKRKPTGTALEWLTKRLTDIDGDGYGIGGVMADPDPFDARVYPFALDQPGNGIDENGVGGDLPANVVPYQENERPGQPWKHKPNVVVFMLESFRFDAVGAAVDGRPVTPVLDRLSRAGLAVRWAFSHNGYTAQSRFHAFSGSLAGLRGGRTLIDDFKANGYEVAYFSGQDESFGGPALGIGFDRADLAYDARQDRDARYSTFSTPGSLAVPFPTVQERIAQFMVRRSETRPIFIYVNFHDTHYPYSHPEMEPLVTQERVRESDIRPENATAVRRTYYNSAANVDRAIGASLAMIEKHLGSAPAVIVTADHGESLFDEGFLGHGYALNDVQTRIPLVVSGLPLRIQEPFGQSELRDAIGDALRADDFSGIATASENPSKLVFQYLGNPDRPRQIALTGSRGARAIFDFRSRKYRDDQIAWTHPEQLPPDASKRFLSLVQFWERLMLAQDGRGTMRENE